MSAPPPLVPEDCDLAGMDSMMLDVGRLRKSRLTLVAKRRPELGWISVLLWGAAWNEAPAASIENDDDVLADRAMVSPERWAEIKDELMGPWVLCSNGRWYHPVVAEKANELWAGRLRKRHEMENGRAAKAWKAAGKSGEAPKSDFLSWLEEHFPVTFAMRQTVFGPDKETKKTKSAPATATEVTDPLSATAEAALKQVSVTEPVTEIIPPENALKVKVKVKENVNLFSEEAKASSARGAENGSRETKSSGEKTKPPPTDEKVSLYAEAREVCGDDAGSLATDLLKACDGNVLKARGLIHDARSKLKPRSYLMGIIQRRAKPGDDVYGLQGTM